jgi:photosystem II stability/assembly factor-like uncharacterized protein
MALYRRVIRLTGMVLVGLALVMTALLAGAQDGGLTDTFSDPAQPGWELSPEATIADGVLRVPGHGSASFETTAADFTLSIRARYASGQGEIVLSYRASDAGAYQTIIGPGYMVLGYTGSEPLGGGGFVPPEGWFEIGISTRGSQHTISIDGYPVLTAADTEHLSGGSMSFRVQGEGVVVEFDDFQLSPSPASQDDAACSGENSRIGITISTATLRETASTGSTALQSLAANTPLTLSATEEGETVTIGGTVSSRWYRVCAGESQGYIWSGLIKIDHPALHATWERTGGPPGGLGYDIRYNFADPNVWYVTDNFAGVHISTDDGYTWQTSNTGIPAQLGPTGDWRPIFCLTVDPHNPQIVWAGTDVTGHIYKSTDGGHTWVQKDNGVVNEWDELSFRGFTIDPRSSDIVYAMGESSIVALGGHEIWSLGDGGVVYKTTDGGETWVKIWDGGTPSALARYLWSDPRDPDVLYVSTGIYDRGAVGQSAAYDSVSDPWGGLGILKSTDGGQSWRILGKDNGLEGLYVGSLYMDPENPDVLLAAVGHEMGAVQRERVRTQGGSPAGIYRTADGGETWEHVYQPPKEHGHEEFSAVEFCPNDPDIAYAGSANAIYRSEDAGQTWTMVSGQTGVWGPPGIRAGWPIDLQCDPRDPDRLFANNYMGGAFLSEDGGVTWINASQGYTGAQVFQVAADPVDPARLYVVARSGGWRSDDGGTTWIGLRNLPPQGAPGLSEWGTIAVDPANPDHVLSVDADTTLIMESSDGGTTWAFHQPSGSINGSAATFAFAPSDPSIVYAGYGSVWCTRPERACPPEGGIAVSLNGGQTWTVLNGALSRVTVADLAVDPANPRIVYAAAEETGLFKSVDGGSTWTQLDFGSVTTGLITDTDLLASRERVQAVAVDPADPQHVLAALLGMGVFSSRDGGQTWQSAYAGLEPNGSIHDLLFDPSDPQVVYAADHSSGVYCSTNGGVTWEKINAGLDNRAAMTVGLSAGGHYLYLGTDGEGVYRMHLTGASPAAPRE